MQLKFMFLEILPFFLEVIKIMPKFIFFFSKFSSIWVFFSKELELYFFINFSSKQAKLTFSLKVIQLLTFVCGKKKIKIKTTVEKAWVATFATSVLYNFSSRLARKAPTFFFCILQTKSRRFFFFSKQIFFSRFWNYKNWFE